MEMIAIILDDVEEAEHKPKKGKWAHEAWKKRDSEGEFANLFKLIDEGTNFSNTSECLELFQHIAQ